MSEKRLAEEIVAVGKQDSVPEDPKVWPVYADTAATLRECARMRPDYTLSRALSVAFYWKETPQGWAFWNEVCDNLEDSERD